MALGVWKALLTTLTLQHSSLFPQRPAVFPKHPQTFISLLTCCSLFCHLILSIFPSQLGLDRSWKVAFFAASPAHILFTSTQNPYLAKRCFFFRGPLCPQSPCAPIEDPEMFWDGLVLKQPCCLLLPSLSYSQHSLNQAYRFGDRHVI